MSEVRHPQNARRIVFWHIRRHFVMMILITLAGALALTIIFGLYLRPEFVIRYANLVFVCQ